MRDYERLRKSDKFSISEKILRNKCFKIKRDAINMGRMEEKPSFQKITAFFLQRPSVALESIKNHIVEL